MARKQLGRHPADVERVQAEFKDWREQRRHGQRIPEDLWKAATRLAGRYGLNRVSGALGLDYNQLKRRCGPARAKRATTEGTESTFVELEAAGKESGTSCVVELEKGNGARLRVSVANAAAVDWCRLKEAFLGA